MWLIEFMRQYALFNISVIVVTVITLGRLRKHFLNKLIKKIKYKKLQWVVMGIISLILAMCFTALYNMDNFHWLQWLKHSGINFVGTWILHDTVNKLLIKKESDYE